MSTKLVLTLLLAASCVVAAESPRRLILVRHAERESGTGAEVNLTEAGRCRAEILAKMLVAAGVDSIYTSEAVRTQQTAAPLVKRIRVTPTVIPASDVAGLLKQLRANMSGVSLVVGHSNTVPQIAQALGSGPVKPIDDMEFDHMLVLTLTGPKTAALVTLRYPGCPK